MSHDLLFFWVKGSILLGITLTSLVRPLLQQWKTERHCIHEIGIYKDQLFEIEQDVQNGILQREYAESRRTDIKRRLLQAACMTEDHMQFSHKRRGKTKVLASLLISLPITLGTVGLYLNRGAPGLQDRPVASEKATMLQQNVERLSEELTQHLEEHPEKVEGWILLARFQRHLGVYAASARSFRIAIERGVEDADTLSSYGEMLVAERDGQITSAACLAFLRSHRKAVGTAHDDPRAAFYMGLAAFQEGNSRCALSIWRGLELYAQPESPWITMLQNHIIRAAKQDNLTPTMIRPQNLLRDSPLCGMCALE